MATNSKNKKMTLDFLVQDGNQYDKLKKITYDNGMFIEIYEKFSSERIDDLLDDCGRFIGEYGKKRNLKESKLIDYINMHILIWFSTLKDDKEYAFDEKVILFDRILKSGYSELIFNSFDMTEVSKVYDRMFKKLATLQEVIKSNVDVRNMIKERIESSDIENKEEIMNVYFNKEKDI